MAQAYRTIEVTTVAAGLVFQEAVATIGEGGVLSIDHATSPGGARIRTVLSPGFWRSYDTEEPQASLGSIRRGR